MISDRLYAVYQYNELTGKNHLETVKYTKVEAQKYIDSDYDLQENAFIKKYTLVGKMEE